MVKKLELEAERLQSGLQQDALTSLMSRGALVLVRNQEKVS
jgi:hypothetical protein